MPYKPVPNDQYTKKMADRDRAVINKAVKSAPKLDWSKLEKIHSILQKKSSRHQSGCFV